MAAEMAPIVIGRTDNCKKTQYLFGYLMLAFWVNLMK